MQIEGHAIAALNRSPEGNLVSSQPDRGSIEAWKVYPWRRIDEGQHFVREYLHKPGEVFVVRDGVAQKTNLVMRGGKGTDEIWLQTV